MGPNETIRPMQAKKPAPRPLQPSPAPGGAEPAAQGTRLNKRLAELGLCSRREADDWIARGWVQVNGKVAEMGTRVQPQDRVTVQQAAQRQQDSRVTILLNKPIGFVSGQPEPGYQPAVTLFRRETQWPGSGGPAFQPSMLKGLAPAGRLDIDSTGLLVLTQDGRIAKQLIGDDSEVEKEYLVRVQGQLSEQGLKLLNHGLELDGRKMRPARVAWHNEDQLRFILKEGRKRQIRRMCELVGLKVVGLKRIRIGRVTLGNLPVGQWRYLGPHERF